MSPAEASWNGATLIERLLYLSDRPADRARPSTASRDDTLAPWARACARGDLTALHRRLAWDGIDADVACAAMAGEAPPDFPIASWVTRFADFIAEAGSCAPAVGTPEWDHTLAEAGADASFVDVWVPVLRAARTGLDIAAPAHRAWLSSESMTALERHLVRELSRLGELTLFEDFRAETGTGGGSHDYLSYVRRLLASRYADIFGAFPVLARQVVLVTDQWVTQTAVLAARLRDDCAAIESMFGAAAGMVQRLTPGLSDRHAGGCRVACVEFASGLRLAYKPRDVRLEELFHATLGWLHRSGLAVMPRPLRVIDRTTHGWVEWVEPHDFGSDDAVRAYFRSAGALVCLAHVMGASDLHSENLIAAPGGPFLVDTEMLLQPSTRAPVETMADEDSADDVSDSCLTSGLVRLIAIDRSGKPFDLGGLQPAASRELAVPMRRWINLRHDDMRFVPEHRIHPVLQNIVRARAHEPRPEDFVDDLCAGFETAYRFLEQNRTALLADGPLSRAAECCTRVLFRPSDQYATAQYLLATPRYQRSGLDRSLAIETFGRVFAREAERPRLWPLVHDEWQALEALDIPRVTLPASATYLESARGGRVDHFYARSGVEMMRSRLFRLCSDDVAYQIDQLRTALGSHDGKTAPPVDAAAEETQDQNGDVNDVLRAAADRVGLALIRRAHAGPDDSYRWRSSRGRADLYAGASGIGLFFAALAAVTRRDTWRDAARKALRGIALEDRDPRIGICTGRPSLAYALALSGRFIEDERLIGLARECASSIPLDAIDTDTVLDIEGGAAGGLVAFLAIHAVSPDERLLESAARCVSRLLATQIQTGAARGAWFSAHDGQARAGFAHGAAGIAYALGRWADHAADAAVTRAVHDAWGFERRLFADNAGTWPAVRRDGGRVVMAAWCHGAPGIALARAATPAALADADVAVEIEAAMRQTLSAPEARLDHLCCGNLGRADVALTAGLRTGTPAWVERGLAMTTTAAARILSDGTLGLRGKGFQVGAPAPEFFQGLSGIGYQLLRAASPSVIPSVLAFEPPPADRPRAASPENRP